MENTVLLEPQHGENANGNIYYLLKELSSNEEYKNYKLYLGVSKKKYASIRKSIEGKNIKNVILMKVDSKQYCQLLAQAHYLITDTSFPTYYIKKEGQVVCNVWHGTPLKSMGRSEKTEYHRLGNIQRNLALSDYLLYPNEYMMNHMVRDYMFANLSNAKVLMEGYPRNEIFFDRESENEIKSLEKLEGKEIFAYMPTWRGTVNDINEGNEAIQEYFQEIDKNLTDNQLLYVNLHPFIADAINYKEYKRIRPFPKKYETYEFLNIADCLITDYSSVFFDFANTRKKIILFAYDEEEYLENRGLYFNFNELPFPNVKTVKDLIAELNSPKQYDDTEFLKKFCTYDNIDASKKVCHTVILEKRESEIRELPKNNKKNILIYPGNLAKNGITTSLINLLQHIDVEKYNYYITYSTRKVTPNKEVLLKLPKQVDYIPILGIMNMPITHKILCMLYHRKIIGLETLLKYVKEDYEYEIKRLYGDTKFDTVVQFNGYEYKRMVLYSLFDANRVIYVHNDMHSEIYVKGNQRYDACKYAYETYDKVALVTEDLMEPTSKIADVKEKMCICNNLFDYQRVLDMSKEDIEFDEQTTSNVDLDTIKSVLNNKKIYKFIAIGRYSKEKGNDRLIEAFEQFWNNHNDSYLIIIGGYGDEYDPLMKHLTKLKCKDNVALIRYMSNPYTVLNQCDSLVLPSRYEGFGLVIIEADVLGKPVVSTDIVGPSRFMKAHGGQMVESSIDGIYQGLEMLYNKKVKPMNVDYDEYNKKAVDQFYEVLNKGK